MWIDTYLQILKLKREKPTLAFLEKIIESHLTVFPFENISKLIYYRDRKKNGFIIPPVDHFLTGYVDNNYGGTCFAINSNLQKLLDELGYETALANLSNEHMAIIVTFAGEKYYIDCGSAAPLFQPIPFETDEAFLASFGNDSVQIFCDAERRLYRYKRVIDGKETANKWFFDGNQIFFYKDFNKIIENANKEGTTFMKLLRCQLWQLDQKRSVSLVNNQFSIRTLDGNVHSQRLSSIEEVENIITNEFMLEKLPIREAITILDDLSINIFAEKE